LPDQQQLSPNAKALAAAIDEPATITPTRQRIWQIMHFRAREVEELVQTVA